MAKILKDTEIIAPLRGGCSSRDHTVSFDAAKAHVGAVYAPKKAFVPIDGGHFACFTNPEQFVDSMRRFVRPLANSR